MDFRSFFSSHAQAYFISSLCLIFCDAPSRGLCGWRRKSGLFHRASWWEVQPPPAFVQLCWRLLESGMVVRSLGAHKTQEHESCGLITLCCSLYQRFAGFESPAGATLESCICICSSWHAPGTPIRSKRLIIPFLFQMSFAKGLLARVDVTVSSRRKTSSWMTPKSLGPPFQTIPLWCCARWPCFWGWSRWGGHGVMASGGGVLGSDCRTWCKRTSHPLFRWWSLSTCSTLQRMRCSSTGDSHVFQSYRACIFCLKKGELCRFIRDTRKQTVNRWIQIWMNRWTNKWINDK